MNALIKYTFTLLFICQLNCMAQDSKKNLYIEFNDKPYIKSDNTDTPKVEAYKLNFNANNSKTYKLSIDKNGNLVKNEFVKSDSPKIVILKYTNLNNDNKETIINASEMINFVTQNEIISKYDIENLMTIFNDFNIYVVKKIGKNKFRAKKVTFEKYSGL